MSVDGEESIFLGASIYCTSTYTTAALDVARAHSPFATAASIDDPVLPALPRLTASSQLP